MNATLDDVWAKSSTASGGTGETLVEHTRRVVQALEGLMRLRPGLPGLLGWDRFWHAAYWACCFHDIGKIAPGFQAQVRENGAIWGQRHEVLSLAFLPWLPLVDDELAWVAAAIASHHRDERVIAKRYPLDLDPEDDPILAIVESLDPVVVNAIHTWLSDWANDEIVSSGLEAYGVRPLAFVECGSSRGALHKAACEGLRGYRRLVRALNSQDGSARNVHVGLHVRGVVMSADRLGSAHAPAMKAVGLGGVGTVLAAMDRVWDCLYEHQRMASGVVNDALLVAPTGSGKTEAAVLWAASGNRGETSRLFYLLPYQASINAMHARLKAFAPGRVGLQHGRSLHALYRGLLEQEIEPRRAAAIARREKSLADLNHPPVRVVTPYQMLKACFRLKGYEAILSDFAGGCFVIDEIHAYEARRLAMILGMVRYLSQHMDTRWFVMSATLPSLIRDALVAVLPRAEKLRAERSLFARFRRHRIQLLDGDLESADGIARIQAAARRGSVLVCCNTVRKAQRVRAALGGSTDQELATVPLLHGGFNARDRRRKEVAVEAAAGVEAAVPRSPIVLVATQVVEVSLNLSFDTIFTDPAPLDALMQRFGRVNRLAGGDVRPVHVFRLPEGGQHVYDPEILRRTMRVLEAHNGEPVDEAAVAEWLDAVYSGPVAEAWRREYADSLCEFEAAVLGTLRPFQSSDELEDLFYDAFDAIEVLPASLEGEYEVLASDDPIAAGELLVSIRKYALGRLQGQGRVTRREEDRLLVVDVPYDGTLGLRVNDD